MEAGVERQKSWITGEQRSDDNAKRELIGGFDEGIRSCTNGGSNGGVGSCGGTIRAVCIEAKSVDS
jgi:hypothetical protein